MKNLPFLISLPVAALLSVLTFGAVAAVPASNVLEDPALQIVNPFTGLTVGQDLVPPDGLSNSTVSSAKPSAAPTTVAVKAVVVAPKGKPAVMARAPTRSSIGRKVANIVVKEVPPPVATTLTAPPAQVPACQPHLLSVIAVGQARSVILDMNGSVRTWPDGAYTPCGKVSVLSMHAATVGPFQYNITPR